MDVIGDQIALLAKVNGVLARRHDVISSNIANISTPNYRAKQLDFENAFQDALKTRGVNDALRVEALETEDPHAPTRADGNSVFVEQEMGAMYRNSMVASVMGQLMQSRLAQVRMAINGR